MGIILFQSREEDHKPLFSTILYDLHDDEDLESVHLHDTITISLDINLATFLKLNENPMSGVRVQKKFLHLDGEESQFEVEFDFEVVKRMHHVTKDWMNDADSPRTSYRSSSTTIHVQASSRDAQSLFLKLQGIGTGNQKWLNGMKP